MKAPQAQAGASDSTLIIEIHRERLRPICRDVALASPLFRGLRNKMRKTGYHQQQRTHWINEALLNSVVMALLRPHDSWKDPSSDWSDKGQERIRVWVPVLLDVFVQKHLVERAAAAGAPNRGVYSRVVQTAVERRLAHPIAALLPPGRLITDLLDERPEPDEIATILKSIGLLSLASDADVDSVARSFAALRTDYHNSIRFAAPVIHVELEDIASAALARKKNNAQERWLDFLMGPSFGRTGKR